MLRKALPPALSWLVVVHLLSFAVADRGLAAGLFHRGDANQDGRMDLTDGIFLFTFLFLGGPAPACRDAADTNDDGRLDITDGIFVLTHLFQGGPPPPPPSFGAPCAGPDPTPDSLDCASGPEPPEFPPGAEISAVLAPPPGVRQRSRIELPRDAGGAYLHTEGTALALLVVGTSSIETQAGFALAHPQNPLAGNPAALEIRCDRELGDPAQGGVPAGENLAPLFLRDIDPWEDREIFLLAHVTLRIPGDSPRSPAPGTYRFTASVMDTNCHRSPEASLTLKVVASEQPEVFVRLEAGEDAPGGVPIQHRPDSGNPRLEVGQEPWIVIDGEPNGRDGPAPDPATLRVTAEPPFPGGPDLTSHFAPISGSPARFAMRLSSTRFPGKGNTDLSISLGAAGVPSRTVRFRLEVPVLHDVDVEPIWRVNCTGCHEEPGPDKGLVLVDPEDVRRNIVNVFAAEPIIDSAAPFLIRPFFPGQSYLLHKIRGTHLTPAVGGDGERMPLGGGYLDAPTEHLIESWVLQGAE